ncbi:hypothetical protein K1F50_18875 [Muricauda oceani]|uniref:DUF6268 domain-containing protein n=1 Tax=Flagellimonas oceani TaxID=2698672 RepID=A0A6G7IY57_9FLAO|nr:DUF6268 family outer membrane beta-barrel protein [Allomuricauda oceani]MBW8244879.1 hypothetical protein [Allomuricauda oceani]QII43541.1 hypothetical protein GVT53_02185 [Allomuricauda oceani]
MKKCLVIAVLMTISVSVLAQETDSIPSKSMILVKKVTDQFPNTRFIDVHFEQLGSSDYESELFGTPYQTGTIESETRVRAAMNLPIVQKDTRILSASLRYGYRDINFGQANVPSGASPIIGVAESQSFHYFFGSVNYTRYDRLFGKTLVSNLSVFGDASDKKFGVLNAAYVASFVLKRNTQTTTTIGLVLQSNPNAVFPILPAFSYEHQFKDSPWRIDMILPKQLYFRRNLLTGGRLSIGTVFEGEPFYFITDGLGDGDVLYNFNRNEIRSGLMYEYKIYEGLILSLRTGWNYFLNGTIRERGQTKEISTTSFDPNFYVNFGVSFNLIN